MFVHPALQELYLNHHRKPKELWISNLTFCPRREYFSYHLPTVRKFTDTALAGILLHRLIQEQLCKEGYIIEERIEYDIGNGWKIVGRVDALKLDHLVEIKTTLDYSKELQDHWISQANLYAYILNLSKFIIIVVERPTGYYQRFEFETNKEKAEELIDLAKTVRDCIVNRVLPKGRIDWCLKFCEFSIFCKEMMS